MPANDSGTLRIRADRVRWLLGFTLVSLTLALTLQPAAASVGWCRSDPVIAVNSITADVIVSVPVDALPQISGPTEIVITTPVDVSIVLVEHGVGFGAGEEVTLAESDGLKVTPQGIELQIDVYVPATSEEAAVLLEFAPHGVRFLAPPSAEGTANEWITLRTVL